MFRRRLERFWRLSGWEPCGGWLPGDPVMIGPEDESDLPAMMPYTTRIKKKAGKSDGGGRGLLGQDGQGG